MTETRSAAAGKMAFSEGFIDKSSPSVKQHPAGPHGWGKRARRYIESGSQKFAATIIW